MVHVSRNNSSLDAGQEDSKPVRCCPTCLLGPSCRPCRCPLFAGIRDQLPVGFGFGSRANPSGCIGDKDLANRQVVLPSCLRSRENLWGMRQGSLAFFLLSAGWLQSCSLCRCPGLAELQRVGPRRLSTRTVSVYGKVLRLKDLQLTYWIFVARRGAISARTRLPRPTETVCTHVQFALGCAC